MCIAILVPPGKRLPDKYLINSFNNNNDGGGCAYIKDGRAVIDKGWMDLSTALKRHHDIAGEQGRDEAMLIHFRIATSGMVGEDNCHPFRIKGGAVIHNGHLWSTGLDSKKSDTREFAETFYNILDYDSLRTAIATEDFEKAIGYNKMAMLYDDGRWVTAGDFHVDGGIHYSTKAYCNYVYSPHDDYDDDGLAFRW